MRRLSISLLGAFQVLLEGEPVTAFESDKVRALLAYLAVEADRPHRREHLAAMLWSGSSERRARRNLSQALFNLRRALSDDEADVPFLAVTPQTLRFDPESDHLLDVTAFTGLLQANQTHTHTNLSTCSPCRERLEQAAALYRGEFLAGLTLRDSAQFDEWALLEREYLHRLVIRALDELTRSMTEHGTLEQALIYAWRLVELDPWQDAACRQLMQLLALTGRRAAALVQYDTFRRTLAEELDVEPEAETTGLFLHIRDEAEARSTPAPSPHNLPAALTPFVGREAELARVVECLREPGCRLLTVTGTGGAGKTRLALEAARAVLPRFPDGVYLVELAALERPAEIVPALAEALGFQFHEGERPRQQLLDYLRHKRALLVLDNFEHLLEGAGLVIDVLRKAPDVRVLATSRERLHLQAEYHFPLSGMDLPTPGQEDGTERAGAVRLFLSGARRALADFRLTSGNLAHVARICHLVEGLPLAILLAAGWVERMAPAEIADRLEQSLDLLAQNWRDVPQRQRSVRAVLEPSWRLLSAHEKTALEQLSVFRGGFTRQAARAIAGAEPAGLQALVDKSLLHRSPDDRYGTHELVRQYAAERLDETPDAGAAARGRHSAYYTAAMERWGAELRTARQPAALAAMAADGENIRAAWSWAAAHGQAERLGRALEGIARFYEWRGWYEEGEAACAAAQAGLVESSAAEALPVRIRLLARRFDFCRLLGRSDTARQHLQEAQALLDAPGTKDRDMSAERAAILLRLGHAARGTDREIARQRYEESLALYQALDDRWHVAETLSALGAIAWNLGRYDEAWRCHEAALALRRALGDRGRIAISLSSSGFTALYQGRLEDAERLIRESLAVRRELGSRFGVADALRNLGLTFLAQGRFGEARALLKESLDTFTELGFRYSLEPAMLAAAEMHEGRYAQARARAEGALVIGRETGFRRGQGLALLVLGELALLAGEPGEAHRRLEEAVAIYEQIGQRGDLVAALVDLGYSARGLGDVAAAQDRIRRAMRVALDTGAFLPLLTTLPAAALLLLDGGAAERAVQVHAAAQRYPFIAASRWFADALGPRWAEAGQHAGEPGVEVDIDLRALVADLLADLGPWRGQVD